jgi:hypothetical protein
MTRTNLPLALPALASVLALVACIPPSSDPGSEAATDTEAAGDDATQPTTGEPTTGADDDGADDGAGPNPQDDGSDETTGASGSDTGDDGESDDGEAEACNVLTHECLTTVPTGWSGPAALAKTTDLEGPAAPCEGAWSEVLDVALFGGFADGGDATCMCGCVPDDVACEVDANLSYWNSNACSGAADGSITVTDGVVIGNPPWIPDTLGMWRINWSTQSLAGSCEPNFSESIPEAAFATRVTACGLSEDIGTCDGGEPCTPRPADSASGEVCIFQDGEHECPAGSYAERRVYYRDIEDTRACPTCECGELSGSCTDEHFTLGYYWGDLSDIEWDNESVPLDGTCEMIILNEGTHNVLSVGAGEPVGGGAFADCSPLPGTDEPSGEAVPTGAVTYCCADL